MKIADVKVGMVVQKVHESLTFEGMEIAYEVVRTYSNGLVSMRKLDGMRRRHPHNDYARYLEPVPPLDGLLILALAELKPVVHDPNEDDPF